MPETMEKEAEAMMLPQDGDYKRYFSLLERAFAYLRRWQDSRIKNQDLEQLAIYAMFARILYTIQALEMKYSHSLGKKMVLDLHSSGFPHAVSIIEMMADMKATLSVGPVAKEETVRTQMLDYMFAEHKRPDELIALMADVKYHAMLDPKKIVQLFTPGGLVLLGKESNVRHYLFSWLCYDSESNIPHVNVMLFEQDESAEILEEGTSTYAEFMKAVKAYGSHVPRQINIVLSDLDRTISWIHPKMLQRWKLGPILSEFSSDVETKQPLLVPLRQWGTLEDFILLIKVELCNSISEKQIKEGWLESVLGSKVRQIFGVNQVDPDCFASGATSITRYMILPHHVLQHLDFASEAYEKYATHKKVPYQGDDINEID